MTPQTKTDRLDSLGRPVRIRHGHSPAGAKASPEYNVWNNMKGRCTRPNHPEWPRYGGRGIKVCDRWLESFANFFADMGERPSPAHSIDRIDNDGNYEPGNCRWATGDVQNRNNRRTRLLTLNGVTKCMKDWCAEYGVPARTLKYRMEKMGMTLEQALTAKKKGVK